MEEGGSRPELGVAAWTSGLRLQGVGDHVEHSRVSGALWPAPHDQHLLTADGLPRPADHYAHLCHLCQLCTPAPPGSRFDVLAFLAAFLASTLGPGLFPLPPQRPPPKPPGHCCPSVRMTMLRALVTIVTEPSRAGFAPPRWPFLPAALWGGTGTVPVSQVGKESHRDAQATCPGSSG